MERTRMCALSRQVLPEGELIRFVAAPDGHVVPDLKARLPGRGMWLEGRREVIAEAMKRKVFARALKQDVSVPEGLADDVAGLLRTQLLGRLGLAARARQAVSGFAKVEAALKSGEAIALLHAEEAAEDGKSKLAYAARAKESDGKTAGGRAEPLLMAGFTSAELGLALGRPHVIHAAVLRGAAADTFIGAALRSLQFETGRSQRPPGHETDNHIASRR
nr:RNA-binding protein [Afifella sp. IM 167]